MLNATAVDDDEGRNGEIQYGFYYLTQFVQETPEFSIDIDTGIIRTRQEFDREETDSHTVSFPNSVLTRYIVTHLLKWNFANLIKHNYIGSLYLGCVLALQLLLVARDRGDPFYESTRYMTVKVTDENDKVPVFPVYRVSVRCRVY